MKIEMFHLEALEPLRWVKLERLVCWAAFLGPEQLVHGIAC